MNIKGESILAIHGWGVRNVYLIPRLCLIDTVLGGTDKVLLFTQYCSKKLPNFLNYLLLRVRLT